MNIRKSILLCFCLTIFPLFSLWAQQEEESPTSLIRQGKKAWTQGDYPAAYQAYRQAQAQATDSLQWAEATYLSGKVLTRQLKLAAGQAALDSVIDLLNRKQQWNATLILARSERSNVEVYRGNFSEASQRLEEVLQDGKSKAFFPDTLQAICLHALGITYIYQNQLEKAREVTRQALAIRRRVYPPNHLYLAYGENSLGTIESARENYQASLQHYLRALGILQQHLPPGHPQIVQITTNIGIHYAELGLFWKALAYHKANLAQLESLPPDVQISCLLNLGSTLMVVGDYQESLEVFDRAEVLINKNPGMREEYQNYLAGERSGIYQAMGAYEKSLESLEEALSNEYIGIGSEGYGRVQKLTRKGLILSAMGKNRESRKAFEAAISFARSNLEPHSMYFGQALEFFGESLIDQGAYAEALAVLEEAEEVYAGGEGKWNLPGVYRHKARALQARGNWPTALQQYRKSWDALLPGVPFRLPTDEKILTHWPQTQVVDLMADLGRGLFQQAQTSKRTEDLQAAWIALSQALALVDSQRNYYEAADSRRLGIQHNLSLYEMALSAALKLARQQDDPAYLEKAFWLSENSKASNLREHLRGQQALRFAGLPDSLREQEQTYRQRLYALDAARFSATADSQQQQQMKEGRFEISQAYRALLATLEQEYPLYYQLRHGQQAWDLDDLQQTLARGDALYAYFWGEEKGFVFRLYQGKLSARELQLDSLTRQHLQPWLHFISQPPQTATQASMAESGSELARQFLPGRNDSMKRLILIPDGRLGYLAFESLLVENPGGKPFFQWPFLGKKVETTYAYALGLWLRSSEVVPKQQAARYLGLAPDFGGTAIGATRAELAPLKYNQEEVAQAASLLDGRALTGPEAQEQACKSLGDKAYILHFATHAIANDSAAMQSYLMLSGEDDSLEDGRLYAWEIYGLEMNSPLTVLSACQTGQGPLARGEGIMSLARAFQYAGSEQVLTTLWQTDDRSGNQISQGFFRSLKSGMPAATALQESRLQYLAEADNLHAHPYFWAGYILIGEGGEVPLKKASNLPLLLLLGGVGILGIIVFFRAKKQKAPLL
jgi:CHAT domain-containing protein